MSQQHYNRGLPQPHPTGHTLELYFILFYFILFHFISFYFILFYFCETSQYLALFAEVRTLPIFNIFSSKSLSFNMADLAQNIRTLPIFQHFSSKFLSFNMADLADSENTIYTTHGLLHVVRARFLAAAFSDGSYLAHVNGAYLRHVKFCTVRGPPLFIVSPISQRWPLPRLVKSPRRRTPASPILV